MRTETKDELRSKLSYLFNRIERMHYALKDNRISDARLVCDDMSIVLGDEIMKEGVDKLREIAAWCDRQNEYQFDGLTIADIISLYEKCQKEDVDEIENLIGHMRGESYCCGAGIIVDTFGCDRCSKCKGVQL